MIRTLIVEPDPWRMRGLAGTLVDSGAVQVLEGPSVDQLMRPHHQATDLDPDVALVAHTLLLEVGLTWIEQFQKRFGSIPVLVHGIFEDMELIADVLASGARGYFPLSSPPGQLVQAVTVLSRGKYWAPREALAILAARSGRTPGTPTPKALPISERILLDLLVQGFSNKEIAQRLQVREATVKARFTKLYRRFGVNTRVQLLTTAVRQGYIGFSSRRSDRLD